MKKNYLFLLILLFASSAIVAQHNSPISAPANKELNKTIPMAKFHQSDNARSSSVVNTERWYNFGDAMDLYHQTYLGDSSALYGNNLFPDTTILVDYGVNGFSGPWIHMLTDILDVKSGYFNDPNYYTDPNELFLNNTTAFYLDSLDIYFIYSRNDFNVTDSLIVEVAVNNVMTTPYFCCVTSTGLAVANNLGTDTVFIKNIPYNYNNNVLGFTSGTRRYAFALDDAFYADSLSNGFHHLAFPTINLPQVMAGRFVVASYQFKPGYSWIANYDTLANKNSVFFISYKESPGATPPSTFAFPSYTKNDFNISYIIPQDVRYNMAGGWNGFNIPSYAYQGGTSSTYSYEHHLIYYKINTINVNIGINEIVNENAVLSQVSPNPVSDIAAFSYKLEKAGNADITITDMAGREVMTLNQGTQNSGIHTVKFDASAFSKGVYFYTLKTGNGSVTKKFTVSR
jgi:hypothetical protein